METKEHPAYRAAKMILTLHKENIEKIDGGTIFLREGVDVSQQIREESRKQIALCEATMERAVNMGELHREQAQSILEEFGKVIEEAKSNDDGLAHIPEIGDYGHDQKS